MRPKWSFAWRTSAYFACSRANSCVCAEMPLWLGEPRAGRFRATQELALESSGSAVPFAGPKCAGPATAALRSARLGQARARSHCAVRDCMRPLCQPAGAPTRTDVRPGALSRRRPRLQDRAGTQHWPPRERAQALGGARDSREFTSAHQAERPASERASKQANADSVAGRRAWGMFASSVSLPTHAHTHQ